MNAPRRRRRVGGLALAIPLLAFAPPGRAEEPAIPALVPVSSESIPDLPGIPAEAATPDRAGESVVDALPGVPSAPPNVANPSPAPAPDTPPASPAPAGSGVAAEPTPESGSADPAPRLIETSAAATGESAPEGPATVAEKERRSTDSKLVPASGFRPLSEYPSSQSGGAGPVYPSEQGSTHPWFTRRKGFTPTEQVTTPPSIHNQARTGAGHFADGAGKVACGVGKMLRGTGQIIGSGFHMLGNATENLFGAGDHLMNRSGHKFFDASQEVAPGLGTVTPAPPVAEPVAPPPPRIVPSGQYAAPQSPY